MIIARQDGDDVVLNLKVVPGAKRTKIVGPLGDALKVAVAAPPSDGAANAAVITLLAETLGVPVRRVAITAGHATPRKVVRLGGLAVDAVLRAFGL